MLDLMAMLKKGYCDGVKVRVGRLQNLISSSRIGKIIIFLISNLANKIHLFPHTLNFPSQVKLSEIYTPYQKSIINYNCTILLSNL